MVLEVVAEVAGQNLPLPDTGSLRGDIHLALRLMAHALEHPLASQIIPDLLAEAARNQQIGATLQEALRTPQQDIGAKIVGRAVARGELPADIDPEVAVDLIVGPALLAPDGGPATGAGRLPVHGGGCDRRRARASTSK